ncbi:hypothetical protein Nepgr_002905 [Nepenthes gracilis]|uniref:Uncharacterized protein n=1 Tax=Nepenthes gracilis TaxID=150966 RepID=A0AAD3P7P8_NEPGR|nr:hypothetical protein Nepgr_002905 [Nepenthes gracilis]
MFTSPDNANHPMPVMDQHYPNSPLHYPSRTYYEIDGGLFMDHYDPPMQSNNYSLSVWDANKNEVNGIVEEMNRRSEVDCNSRSRSSKRDRHSKINTAQGLRDRRMRLSYEVASEFFKLQDLLGFDKASTTVKWLLMQSKPAIEDLDRKTKGSLSTSSTSECEVVVECSTVDDGIAINCGAQKERNSKGNTVSSSSFASIENKAKQSMRRNAFDPLAKQLRKEARARARERTREKGMTPTTLSASQTIPQTSQNLRDPIETAEHFNGTSLDFTGNWSPFTTFNCQHNSEIFQVLSVAEFQSYGASWDEYSKLDM